MNLIRACNQGFWTLDTKLIWNQLKGASGGRVDERQTSLFCQSWFPLLLMMMILKMKIRMNIVIIIVKNTIIDGESTALYNGYTAYIVYTVYTVYTVEHCFHCQSWYLSRQGVAIFFLEPLCFQKKNSKLCVLPK